MSDEWLKTAFRSALRAIEGGGPKNLIARARPDAEDRGVDIDPSNLTVLLRDASESESLLTQLGMLVHSWDVTAADTEWTEGSPPSTPERRELICMKLGLDADGATILLERRPIFHDRSIVISGDWKRWYTPERAEEHAFYWPRYRDHLLNVRRWPADSVSGLHRTTSQVIERIADPIQTGAYPSKGLVVGYVQSGKTANFTGVAAKAIDAGYRLVIVMTGTIEMLRAQTQRRMDMELVGRQNILGDLAEDVAREAGVDYQEDLDWIEGRFLDLDTDDPPTEIQRLTRHHSDYKRQFRTLRMERFDPSRPLFDPSNLFRSAARIAVVKKNSGVLKHLVTDIKANRNAFTEIPVLIIDDESDQASVNTVDPEKVARAKLEGREIQERRAINQHIASMLELMPRAQYIGYTATPFANVFVDPSDDIGIFPKDFVIGLERPKGYMGVTDFHDLQEIQGKRDASNSNEMAYVRNLVADDEDDSAQLTELAHAIDMFVLTGAVKLHRQAADKTLQYRHHTMLVHRSVRQDDQKDLALAVRKRWVRADYARPAAKARLRRIYEDDIAPTSLARKEPGMPAMPSFDQLVPYIGQTIGKIAEHGNNPVIVVNSDQDVQRQQQTLDFDRYDTWRILVGGSKLSRGFTVEGLTVTYFRRATNMSDSLTQMGRWFGFRRGYQDLVRLYIARKARFGRATVDLYEAFESIAVDEAAFREQLEQYARWEGDEPVVRPIDIPPLVQQHLPWLQPTAKNKMFNAELVEQSEQGFTPSGYPNSLRRLKKNLDLWRPVFAQAQQTVVLPEGPDGTEYTAFICVVEAADLLGRIAQTDYLEQYGSHTVEPKLVFYRRLVEQGELRDFLIVVPQPATDEIELGTVGPRRVVSRDRRAGRAGKFGEITDKKHRPAIQQFVEGRPPESIAQAHEPTRGAILLYLVREQDPNYEDPTAMPETDPERGVLAGYSIWVPDSAIRGERQVLRFQVRDGSRADEPTIEERTPASGGEGAEHEAT